MRQWRGFRIHGVVSSGHTPAALDRQKLKFWASVRGTLKTWLGTEWLGRLSDFLELGAPFCASGHHKPNLATRFDQMLRSPGNVITTPSSTSGFQHLNTLHGQWNQSWFFLCLPQVNLQERFPQVLRWCQNKWSTYLVSFLFGRATWLVGS